MKKILVISILSIVTTLQAQSYKRLHKKAIVADTHNDIPSKTIEKKLTFDTNLKGKAHSDLKRMKKGGIDVQMFSIFCDGEQINPYAYANQEIDSVYAWVQRNPSKMMIVKTPEQLKQALKEKKLASMLGVEGGHMIEDKIENLENLFQRGARYMTLTWNNSTSWATSAADETTKKDSLPFIGLTEKGKEIVKRMNQLGIMVDVSHLGERSFWDVVSTSTKPIIASHSCVYNLCPHRRNLKDDQIKAIAKSGGVIYLNFYSGFLDSTYEKKANAFKAAHKAEIDELIKQNVQPDYAFMFVSEKHKSETADLRAPLSKLLDHLDYIVKLVGINHVGIGSDFDGIEAPPQQLNGVQNLPILTKAMLQHGYSKADVYKILGENFIRVFEANSK